MTPPEHLIAQFIANRVGRDSYEYIDVQLALSLLDYLKENGWDLVEVPEVEVTYAGSSLHVEASERPPEGRRSAAKNLSAPNYQRAFISEARSVMGQPNADAAEGLVGRKVRLVFNDDKPPVEGVLAHVVSHPTAVYLVLDGDETRYPLNAIQEIKSL